MIVVIPAYKPDEKLIKLICDLKEITSADIITVDDGGKESYRPIFEKCEALGCKVLVHPENKGKGEALKTAFRYISENYSDIQEIVTCDADGQHLPKDIVACLDAAKENPHTLIIGGRNFKGDVPVKSRLGNFFSRWTFKILFDRMVFDTQTGLRAFTSEMIPDLLNVAGERYEYEMQMLCDFVKKGIPFLEIGIETVYIEENASSHFNPFRDAMRVYSIMFKNTRHSFFQVIGFIFSSLLSTLIDVSLLAIMQFILSFSLAETYTPSFLVARTVSSVINYAINRKIFNATANRKKSFSLYVLLVLFIAFLNWTIAQKLFIDFDIMSDVLSHICAMTICFPISYVIQKYFIFPDRKKKK